MFSPANLSRRVWKAGARGWGCKRLQRGSVRKLQGGINKQGQEVRPLITVGRSKPWAPLSPHSGGQTTEHMERTGQSHGERVPPLLQNSVHSSNETSYSGPQGVSCLVDSWEEALPEA